MATLTVAGNLYIPGAVGSQANWPVLDEWRVKRHLSLRMTNGPGTYQNYEFDADYPVTSTDGTYSFTFDSESLLDGSQTLQDMISELAANRVPPYLGAWTLYAGMGFYPRLTETAFPDYTTWDGESFFAGVWYNRLGLNIVASPPFAVTVGTLDVPADPTLWTWLTGPFTPLAYHGAQETCQVTAEIRPTVVDPYVPYDNAYLSCFVSKPVARKTNAAGLASHLVWPSLTDYSGRAALWYGGRTTAANLKRLQATLLAPGYLRALGGWSGPTVSETTYSQYPLTWRATGPDAPAALLSASIARDPLAHLHALVLK
jgi:hypothetical protein